MYYRSVGIKIRIEQQLFVKALTSYFTNICKIVYGIHGKIHLKIYNNSLYYGQTWLKQKYQETYSESILIKFYENRSDGLGPNNRSQRQMNKHDLTQGIHFLHCNKRLKSGERISSYLQ
jgi:hypothetical protein